MAPDAFWTQTPRTLDVILSGRAEARLRRYELAMSQAWHTAAFIRMKKFPRRVPDLRKRAGATPDNPQSGAEVLAIMRQLVAATNGRGKAE
ncbi:hypothetical protein [Sphingobium sp.]|uniref:hypothetical protein n=1 Tax=Sphingobium sp. TaxID=1912891 RepID=UPI0026059E0E|nr:hypothetical protein [Sphingobium sp.]